MISCENVNSDFTVTTKRNPGSVNPTLINTTLTEGQTIRFERDFYAKASLKRIRFSEGPANDDDGAAIL